MTFKIIVILFLVYYTVNIVFYQPKLLNAMKFYQKAVLFLFAILINNNAFCQIGVRVSHLMPRGNYGVVFESGKNIDIEYYLWDYESRWSSSISIGINILNKRMDTIPSIVSEYSDEGLRIIPGYEIIKDYKSFPFGLNNEFKILKTKLSPFIGLDVYLHYLKYSYETYRKSGIIDGTYAIGYQPRIGIQFDNKKGLVINSGIGKIMSIDLEYVKQKYWKGYFSVRYYFKSRR